MRKIALLSTAVILIAVASPALAQNQPGPADLQPSMQGAIKGTMDIDFKSRTSKDPEGRTLVKVSDVYKVNLEYGNTVMFTGEVRQLPWLPRPTLGTTLQNGNVTYALDLALRNPANPTQTRTVGKWTGGMTLDGDGVYDLNQAPADVGPMRVAIDTVGTIQGFTSNFGGKILGRKPERVGLVGRVSKARDSVEKEYARMVDGKVVKHKVKGADPVTFQNVKLASGPTRAYPEAVVSGSIDYDAETSNWYVDVHTQYAVEGRNVVDRYSGTIRWSEEPVRSGSRLGKYELNVRVNEKEASAGDAFAAPASSNEDAFFAADTQVPGFSGTVSYRDTMTAAKVVTGSAVTYAVNGNQVSRIHAINFGKILSIMIKPFNDE